MSYLNQLFTMVRSSKWAVPTLKQTIILLACCFGASCDAWNGPLLTCPESIGVGEEIQLLAVRFDDAIWSIDDGDQTGAVFICLEEFHCSLPDETDSTRALTSPLISFEGGPARTVIFLRAQAAGTLVVHAEETTIGPGIGFPRPMGSGTCTIEVVEAEPSSD